MDNERTATTILPINKRRDIRAGRLLGEVYITIYYAV